MCSVFIDQTSNHLGWNEKSDSRLLAPFVIWKVADFRLLVLMSKRLFLSVGEEQEPQKRGGASCRMWRGERERRGLCLNRRVQLLGDSEPSRWCTTSLASLEPRFLPLARGRAWLGRRPLFPCSPWWGGAPGKGRDAPSLLALLNQSCPKAAGSDLTCCQSRALVGKEGVSVATPDGAQQETQAHVLV